MTGIEFITIERLLVGFGAAFAALGGIAALSLAVTAVQRRVTRLRRAARRGKAARGPGARVTMVPAQNRQQLP